MTISVKAPFRGMNTTVDSTLLPPDWGTYVNNLVLNNGVYTADGLYKRITDVYYNAFVAHDPGPSLGANLLILNTDQGLKFINKNSFTEPPGLFVLTDEFLNVPLQSYLTFVNLPNRVAVFSNIDEDVAVAPMLYIYNPQGNVNVIHVGIAHRPPLEYFEVATSTDPETGEQSPVASIVTRTNDGDGSVSGVTSGPTGFVRYKISVVNRFGEENNLSEHAVSPYSGNHGPTIARRIDYAVPSNNEYIAALENLNSNIRIYRRNEGEFEYKQLPTDRYVVANNVSAEELQDAENNYADKIVFDPLVLGSGAMAIYDLTRDSASTNIVEPFYVHPTNVDHAVLHTDSRIYLARKEFLSWTSPPFYNNVEDEEILGNTSHISDVKSFFGQLTILKEDGIYQKSGFGSNALNQKVENFEGGSSKMVELGQLMLVVGHDAIYEYNGQQRGAPISEPIREILEGELYNVTHHIEPVNKQVYFTFANGATYVYSYGEFKGWARADGADGLRFGFREDSTKKYKHVLFRWIPSQDLGIFYEKMPVTTPSQSQFDIIPDPLEIETGLLSDQTMTHDKHWLSLQLDATNQANVIVAATFFDKDMNQVASIVRALNEGETHFRLGVRSRFMKLAFNAQANLDFALRGFDIIANPLIKKRN